VREERFKEQTKSINQLRKAERDAEERRKETSRGNETDDTEREEQRTRSDVLRRQRSEVNHCFSTYKVPFSYHDAYWKKTKL
jgi:hypothetical protein